MMQMQTTWYSVGRLIRERLQQVTCAMRSNKKIGPPRFVVVDMVVLILISDAKKT
jgi:hypothetical protein